MLTPWEARSHLFWHLIPYRSKVMAILYFLTTCKSKVTIIYICWYVDPLQKQGHICFGTWSPAEARSWPFFILQLPAEAKSQLFKFVDMLTPCRSKVTFVLALDPLQKQGLGYSLFFDSLQKRSHNYLNLLICWPPAEARSHLFWHLIPYRSKVMAILYFLTTCKSKVTII